MSVKNARLEIENASLKAEVSKLRLIIYELRVETLVLKAILNAGSAQFEYAGEDRKIYTETRYHYALKRK